MFIATWILSSVKAMAVIALMTLAVSVLALLSMVTIGSGHELGDFVVVSAIVSSIFGLAAAVKERRQ